MKRLVVLTSSVLITTGGIAVAVPQGGSPPAGLSAAQQAALTGAAQKSNNLADLGDPSQALINLGGVASSTLGFAKGKVPGPLGDYYGSSYPYWPISSRLYFVSTKPGGNDFADLLIDRDATSVATGSGLTSALRVSIEKGPNTGSNEWSILGVCSSLSKASTGSCVGSYGEGIRQAGGTDGIWGGITDAIDQTGTASNGKNGTLGLESDIEADAADNAANGNMVTGTGNRIGQQVVGYQHTAGAAASEEIAAAYWVTSYGGTGVFFDSLYSAMKNQRAYVGLDTRGVIPPGGASYPVTAVAMAAGQYIDFAAPSTDNAAPGAPVYYSADTKAIVSILPLQSQSGVVQSSSAARTIATGDCGSVIRDTATASHAYTVNPGLPVGCEVAVIQAGNGGTIVFAAGAGETLEQYGSGTLAHATAGQYARATIKIDSAATFLLGGQVN